MKSKTVTVRIDLDAIVSCADLLKKNGLPIEKQPPSTVIRTAVESMMELLRQKRQLPTYTDEDEVYDQYLLYFEQEDEMTNGGLDLSGLDRILKKPKGDDIANIASRVEAHLSGNDVSGITRSTDPVETPDISRLHSDIMTMHSMSFEDIQKQAPKDQYVELCLDPQVDAVFKKAVCIAYTSLPVQEWGTQTADRIIRELMQMHKA